MIIEEAWTIVERKDEEAELLAMGEFSGSPSGSFSNSRARSMPGHR